MTILSADTLLNVLDLIADGATVVETTTAIGGAPKSKIIFAWLADSEAAGEFDPPPDPESKWCITWRDKLEWFHLHYRTAVTDGREIRKVRKSPIRADLEARLAAKRSTMPSPENTSPLTPTPHARMAPTVYDVPAPPPPAPPRPAYAYRRAPPLDTVNTRNGPPSEGRFTMATQRYSKEQRRAGTIELTETGIKQW
jgi:hypothetical protein